MRVLIAISRRPAALLLLLATLVLGRALLPDRVLSAADILFTTDPWKGMDPGYRIANPLLSDQALQFHCWLIYGSERIRSGDVPLWNPHAFAGAPFFGNPLTGVLFPLNALGYVLPPPRALGLIAILKLALSGIFTLWYLRALRLGASSAFLGAVAFMFSGFMIVWLGWPHTNVAMFLPLLFLLTERLRWSDDATDVAWLAAAVALQFLGGHPETSFHIVLAALGYALFRARGARPRVFLARVAVAMVLGALLAAVQLLPFLEYLGQSATLFHRSAGSIASHLGPRGLPALIAPNAFGNPIAGDYRGPLNYNEVSGWFGPTAWVLAACAVALAWRRGVTTFFACTAAVTGLAVYGPKPFSDALSLLPLFSLSLNTRLLVVLGFCFSVLAAIGMDSLRAASDRTSPRRAGPALLIAVVAAMAAWSLVLRDRAPMPARFAEGAIAILLVVATAILATIAIRRGGASRPILLAFIGLELAGVAPHARSYNPVIEQERFYPLTPALVHLRERLKTEDSFRVLMVAPNVGAVFGLSGVTGYDAMTPRRVEMLVDRTGSIRGGVLPLRFTESLDAQVLDLFNARYVLAPPRSPSLGAKFVVDYDGPDARIYRNTRALPRAFVAARARTGISDSDALALIRSGAVDLEAEVLIADDIAAFPPALSPASRPRIVSYEPERVVVRAEMASAGYLVLTDTHAPGWEVRVDGRRAPLLRADVAFRAVALDAGSHEVVFTYRPLSVRVGAAISASAALLLVLPALAKRRRMTVGAPRAPVE